MAGTRQKRPLPEFGLGRFVRIAAVRLIRGDNDAEQALGGLDDFRVERPRLQGHIHGEAVGDNAQRRDPSVELVIGGNEAPRRATRRSLLHHIFDRDLVILPAPAIAEVLVGQFPPFQRIHEALAESVQLLLGGDVQEQLDHPHPVVEQHAFEVVDLIVGPASLVGGRKTLDPFDQHSAVPRTIERHDLPVAGQALPKTLEVVQRLLSLARRGGSVDLETPGIERPAERLTTPPLPAVSQPSSTMTARWEVPR